MVVILNSNIEQTAKNAMILIVSVLGSNQNLFHLYMYVEDKQAREFLIQAIQQYKFYH